MCFVCVFAKGWVSRAVRAHNEHPDAITRFLRANAPHLSFAVVLGAAVLHITGEKTLNLAYAVEQVRCCQPMLSVLSRNFISSCLATFCCHCVSIGELKLVSAIGPEMSNRTMARLSMARVSTMHTSCLSQSFS